MSNKWIMAILFFIYLLEGTVLQYMNTDYYGSTISLYPHFVLGVIILISIYLGKQKALFWGLLFGLLYDIVFGRAIGLYMIGMAGVGYLGGWIIQFFHPTFFFYIFIQFIGQFMFELYLFSLLRLYQLTELPIGFVLTHMSIPSTILNLLFAIFIFPLSRLLIENSNE